MRRYVRLLLHLAVFVLSAFFLVLVLQQVGFHRVGSILLRCEWVLIPAAFLAMTGRYLAWNLRWMVLTRTFFPARFWNLFPMLMAGAFTNTVVPGTRAGGGLVRAFFLARATGRPFSTCYGGVLLDAAFQAGAFVLLGLSALPFATLAASPTAPRTSGPTVLAALAATLFVALLGLLHRRKRRETGIAPIVTFLHHLLPAGPRRRFATPAELQQWIAARLREFVSAFRALPDQPGPFWVSALLSLGVYGFLFLCNDLLFRSLGSPVGILPIVSAVTLSGALGTFFLTPGGIGVADAALVGVYLAFSVEPDLAVAVSILYRVILYGHGLAVGFPCLMYLQWRHGRVRPDRIPEAENPGPVPA